MGFKKRKQKPKPICAVRTGQTYRVARTGKPFIHIKIVRVWGVRGDRPKATYRKVNRNTGALIGPKKMLPNVRWLCWDDGTWTMGAAFELVA